MSDEQMSKDFAAATEDEFRAARAFVAVLNALDGDAQRAWILYLADRYLGVKPRDWML